MANFNLEGSNPISLTSSNAPLMPEDKIIESLLRNKKETFESVSPSSINNLTFCTTRSLPKKCRQARTQSMETPHQFIGRDYVVLEARVQNSGAPTHQFHDVGARGPFGE
ncbi:hypothetical protein CR513_54496, partial [Mucuna pruriens]